MSSRRPILRIWLLCAWMALQSSIAIGWHAHGCCDDEACGVGLEECAHGHGESESFACGSFAGDAGHGCDDHDGSPKRACESIAVSGRTIPQATSLGAAHPDDCSICRHLQLTAVRGEAPQPTVTGFSREVLRASPIQPFLGDEGGDFHLRGPPQFS